MAKPKFKLKDLQEMMEKAQRLVKDPSVEQKSLNEDELKNMSEEERFFNDPLFCLQTLLNLDKKLEEELGEKYSMNEAEETKKQWMTLTKMLKEKS